MRVILLFIFVGIANAFYDNGNVENIVNIVDYDPTCELQDRRYTADWEDLDKRPIPEWYDEAKIGIFLHWGVFSVPSYKSEWFWDNWNNKRSDIVDFMKRNYPPNFTYQEFAPMFTAEFFDPVKWAKLFADSGAKYIVLTSKHHEGYTLFPSRHSFSWNAAEVGPKRDLVGELAEAVRNKNLKFGLYHSLYEWFNPIYLQDKKANFTTRDYPDTKLWPDLKQIVNDYKPSVIWADGDWEAYDTYWNSTGFLAWLYNDSPVKDEVLVNDRWGIGIPGHHGDFYNHDDRYNPGVLQKHKWENAFTVDSTSWGYRRDMELSEILNINQLLREVVSTVSCGGNVLINIGPTKEGTIVPIFQERLLSLGKWLSFNGEAIYASSPWIVQNDTLNGDVWYTCKKPNQALVVYVIFLNWPVNDVLKVKSLTTHIHKGNYIIEMLGNEGTYLNWQIINGVTKISLLDKATVKSQDAWTLKISSK